MLGTTAEKTTHRNPIRSRVGGKAIFGRNNKKASASASASKSALPPACSDSNGVLTAKTVLSAAIETAGLLGLLKAATLASPKVNDWLGDKKFLPSDLPTRAALFLVIFSSSSIKAVLDGSLGAATSQVSKPNTTPGDTEWYQNLKKPWFTPPGWFFPIMWLVIAKPTQFIGVSKLLLAFSNKNVLSASSSAAATTKPVADAVNAGADVVLQQTSSLPWWPALTVYCAHLALGDAWNEVFFGCQRIGLGVGVIVTFLGLLATSAKLFYDIEEQAGMFLLPTCAWVCVATALNLSIYFKNKPSASE